MNLHKKPTEQELLNAGFKDCGNKFFEKSTEGLLLRIALFNEDQPQEGEGMLLFGRSSVGNELSCDFTKQNIQIFWKTLTGEVLDFEEKEKTYSWESCADNSPSFRVEPNGITRRFEIDSEYIKGKIEGFKTTHKTAKGAEQAYAMAQLSFIIAAIDKDYPQNDRYYFGCILPLNDELQAIQRPIENKKGYLIALESLEGAEVLLKHHEKLIKQALML